MGKITGDNLKFVSDHMKSCEKATVNKRRIVVTADNQDNVFRLGHILSDAYMPKRWTIAYTRTVYLDFEYMWQRDQALQEINAEVNAYRTAHSNGPGSDEPTSDSPSGTETKTVDWTTYLLIGAAAAIILLLIWPKKR